MSIRYASDNYYSDERKIYRGPYQMFLNDVDVPIILRKLCNHYRVRFPRIRFRGHSDSGSASMREIRLSHNPSMGLIIHEFGHLVQTQSEFFKKMWVRIKNKGTAHHGLHFQITLNQVHLYARGKGYWIEQLVQRAERRKVKKELDIDNRM